MSDNKDDNMKIESIEELMKKAKKKTDSKSGAGTFDKALEEAKEKEKKYREQPHLDEDEDE